jgi:hypothetical protein
MLESPVLWFNERLLVWEVVSYKQLTKLMEQQKVKDTTRELTSGTLDLWT